MPGAAHCFCLCWTSWSSPACLGSSEWTCPPPSYLLLPQSDVQIINKDVEQYWLHYEPWGLQLLTCYQLYFVLLITILLAQQSRQFATHFTIQSITHWLKDTIEDPVKGLVKSKVNIHSSSTVSVISSEKEIALIRLVRHNLPLVNRYWLLPVTFLSFMWLEVTSKKIGSPRTEVRRSSLSSFLPTTFPRQSLL